MALLSGISISLAAEQGSSLVLKAEYDDGFCLSTTGEETLSLCLGGLLQVDYRHFRYESEDPNNDGFDIRRARLLLGGHVGDHFDFFFQYEFQGAASRRLLDGYANVHLLPFLSFRIGQFKTPFSLEQFTADKDLFFSERSMGFYLTPSRDLGLMAYASLWQDRINYGLGIFNGNGVDDSVKGDEDAPAVIGRVAFAPLRGLGNALWENLQVGGSLSYGRIDPTNVEIHVFTAGLTEFFDVASRAKFNIIREADSRRRYGAEFAWTYGPVALTAEYIHVLYKEVETSTNLFDIELENTYVSLVWFVTGEKPTLANGVYQPIKPLKSVWKGGWGAFGVGFRYDSFHGDESAYENLINAGDSVREATGYSIVLNWYLNPWARIVLDGTRTEFDEPLLIDRDPLKGTAIYSDHEDVIVARFQLQF